MTNFKKLKEILILEDINEAIIELDIYICTLCEFGDDLGKLTEQQKIFFLNQNLEREINNGGFNKYFINSSGENSHETLASLKAIGADKTANILQKAIELFPNKTVPKDSDERFEVVEQIEKIANEIWSELDEKFYEYEDDLNALNLEYIKKNKDFF